MHDLLFSVQNNSSSAYFTGLPGSWGSGVHMATRPRKTSEIRRECKKTKEFFLRRDP